MEIFCKETVRIENKENLYVDLKVQALFSEESLGDPSIFNSSELEGHPVGSIASYRSKIIVSGFIFNLGHVIGSSFARFKFELEFNFY